MKEDIINQIRKISIIALASDDELVESLVLKGGNALELTLLNASSSFSRTSYDIDYSIINGDFKLDLESIGSRIEKTLSQTFLEYNYIVLDFSFTQRPGKIRKEVADFWGGYLVRFKIIERDTYLKYEGDKNKITRNAIPLHPNNSNVFELEFSKHEYVDPKVKVNVDGYSILIYTPAMILFEKVRAICQQLPVYSEIVPSFSPRPRAKDFYDIYLVKETFGIDPSTNENKELISNIFSAKRVSLSYLKQIESNKSLHELDWINVKDTVFPGAGLKNFDFYFNYVVDSFSHITFP